MKEFENWLIVNAKQCKSAAAGMHADCREDEAVFAKIKCNVYELFFSVFQAFQKHASSPEEAGQLFERKLQEIPNQWVNAHKNAINHHDSEKAYLEELKLDTAKEIRSAYYHFREEHL